MGRGQRASSSGRASRRPLPASASAGPQAPALPSCHGRPLQLVAESPAGRRLIVDWPRQSGFDKGIPFARWRCGVCGSEHDEGWLPPTWIGAVAAKAFEIRRELQEALALLEAREGRQRALSGPERAVEPSGGLRAASGAPVAATGAGQEGGAR